MMERMFKRVGLHSSKRVTDNEKQLQSVDDIAVFETISDSDRSPGSGDHQWCDLLSFKTVCIAGTATVSASNNQIECEEPVIRRQRKLRVFNFHYLDSHAMEFKPRALTRRLCGGKKQDNELYRSNSFKFERFERLEDSGQLTKQVSLCDDYSLPVDFVNKRRPHSFGAGPGLLNWTTPSPAGEQVEIVEAYCDPRDSKAYLEPGEEASGKVYTSPDRDYSQPYTDGSEPRSPELDEAGVYEDVGLPEDEAVTLTCEECEPVRRNPSPYYYGDLFRDGDSAADVPPPPPPYRKSASLDAASPVPRRPRPRHRSCLSAEGHALMPPAPRRQVCACAGGAQPDDAEESPSPLDEPPVDYDVERGFFDMSGRRLHVYETAFDCRVDRSDDDLDDVDRVALHAYAAKQAKQSRPGPSEERRKVTLVRDDDDDEAALCRAVDAVALDDAPSPPSTAPLPAKFHGGNKDVRCINSVRSAPNLPASGPARLKDLRLPVKSLRARDPSPGKSRGVLDFKGRSGVILEFKGRPPLTPRRCPVAVRPKYSSTESMATSSSGGSLESIRSSTSEGNRSTSSSESRRSSSLSSHSSDSGGGPRTHHHHHHHLPCVTPVIGGGFFAHHQGNKLHILSPISDKSSQEPASETSDNNRNNNSQKGSPEDNTDNTVTSPPAELESLSTKPPKRRTPQNKNLVKLSLQASAESEIQGSDSGISIGWCAPDLADLPFDMPKLRRRRMQMQAEAPPSAARSSDASSVDLGDLPFDMPKLRRRIRASPPESSASSSQSVRHSTGTPHMGLTLNLGNASPLRRPALSLDLAVGAAAPGGVDLSLPLERQGWYHGALSRIEAENVLRVLREGSYLVRNSESTRHDYSLSLKSARGFMHMRIQRNKESGKFILGQFSKPFDNIPEMIQHYSVNQLPIRGAEHMCLLHPVIEQLL